ncbi:MAG: FGGY family carbohydrate kinase [Chloroflexi bacterium]|nr:FGGY family carbohydrate kinase [Chloroflexota bacterium]MCL5273545.1 FGGY family carbohydrate kinase [Chloroflexota bacterium]
MAHSCVIALDLGTTAFKCAPVGVEGLLAEPTSVNYDLEYHAGEVTFKPDGYLNVATAALAGAMKAAHSEGLVVSAIGISSQAQTYIPLNHQGKPLQDAVVWTDDRATDEAREAAAAIPDFIRHSGFRQPLPAMFMPKIKHFARHSGVNMKTVWKFALLNEYIIYRLTGSVYGDTTNQGMSGFYHIADRHWSPQALTFAGITEGQLADTGPAAVLSHQLAGEWCHGLGLPPVPVYSCGNDQSCSAAGAGLSTGGEVLCNFGAAMVIYALKDELPADLSDKQIAGINPLTDRYFLLGLENECGNVLDWANRVFYAGQPFGHMMTDALRDMPDPAALPRVSLPGGGRINIQSLTVGSERRHLVRALLELYADTFGELLSGVTDKQELKSLYVAGGLSRSEDWLKFLKRRFNIEFAPTGTEQAALAGVAKIIDWRNRANGASL